MKLKTLTSLIAIIMICGLAFALGLGAGLTLAGSRAPGGFSRYTFAYFGGVAWRHNTITGETAIADPTSLSWNYISDPGLGRKYIRTKPSPNPPANVHPGVNPYLEDLETRPPYPSPAPVHTTP